jgi:hypothetical protein
MSTDIQTILYASGLGDGCETTLAYAISPTASVPGCWC